jgi:hypothetical protein
VSQDREKKKRNGGSQTPKMTGLRPLLVNHTIGCDQSAFSMRFRAGLACAEFTLLPRSGPTSRTTDSEYPLGARFLLHKKKFPMMNLAGLVNVERFLSRCGNSWKLIEVQGPQ